MLDERGFPIARYIANLDRVYQEVIADMYRDRVARSLHLFELYRLHQVDLTEYLGAR
jgi:hypothetical protein